MKKQIIIDTDPGCDDAVAIIIALKNCDKFDLKLISTVGGNISVENCTKNALFLVEKFAQKTIPVAMGENSNEKTQAKNVHGEKGLGKVRIGKLQTKHIENGIDILYEKIIQSESKTVLLTLGPLTNIAHLFQKHPDCKGKIDYIFAMAGSTNGSGNITPFAEFNVYSNPKAFDYVIKSGVKMIFSPMQTGVDCIIDKSQILNRKTNSESEKIIHDIIDGAFEPGRPDEFAIFDAQVVLGLLYPELYEFKNCDVEINLNVETRGQTFMRETTKETNFKIQKPKDCEKIKQKLLEELYKWGKNEKNCNYWKHKHRLRF